MKKSCLHFDTKIQTGILQSPLQRSYLNIKNIRTVLTCFRTEIRKGFKKSSGDFNVCFILSS